MGLNVITISFKNDEEDIELKNWIESHSNKSGFIKDILRKVKNGETNTTSFISEPKKIQKEVIKAEEEKVKLIDLTDV